MENKVYQYVTDRIMTMLNEGTVPWRKSWSDGNRVRPLNYVSRKPYSGINQFLLSRGGEYLTYKQAQAAGGQVRKGAKAEMVVFFRILEKEDKKTGRVDRVPILRYYNVFHITDCEGIESKLPKVEPLNQNQRIEACEEIASKCPVPIVHKECRCFYRPSEDFINMPEMSDFTGSEEYYVSLFHEMIHSTGHETRLNRDMSGMQGDHKYSFEELVAEMGAAMLAGEAGTEVSEATIENNAAYVASWLRVLKNDNKMVVKAATKAKHACAFILENKISEVEEEEEEPQKVPL